MILYSFDPTNEGKTFDSINGVTITKIIANSAKEVATKVLTGSDGLIYYSNAPKTDFVVPNESSREYLQGILEVGQLDFTISVQNSEIFTTKCKQCICINTNIDIDISMLKYIVTLYFGIMSSKANESTVAEDNDIVHIYNVKEKNYRVKNVRNGNILYSSKRLELCQKMCDSNPCCIIIDENNTIVYKSKYGKVLTGKRSEYPKVNTANNRFNIKIPVR